MDVEKKISCRHGALGYSWEKGGWRDLKNGKWIFTQNEKKKGSLNPGKVWGRGSYYKGQLGKKNE